MLFKKGVFVLFASLFLFVSSVFAVPVSDEPSVEDYWDDFIHYATIGRIELARGYGQKLLDSEPDPLKLLKLSEKNSRAYKKLLDMNNYSGDLQQISGNILDIIERGRYLRRTDPSIIVDEIRRLSGTIRGQLAAERRLNNSGEFAIPFMIDFLLDPENQNMDVNITNAMEKMDRDIIRPLVAALDMEDVGVKAQIIKVLGQIGYPQSLAYLKYIEQNSSSSQLRSLAAESINKIDPSAIQIPAAELFYQLGLDYYDHAGSLSPRADFDFANIWFWDEGQNRLVREEVAKDYFNELMAMRSCEWALRADPSLGKGISLWVAAFFKAESTGIEYPEYFGSGHAGAMTYATTTGPVYLHRGLDKALEDGNAYVALQLVEALAASAGQNSLLYTFGTDQPLVNALSFDDRAVRYSAAIAIGQANPPTKFVGSELIINNLAQAAKGEVFESMSSETASEYALRSLDVLHKLALVDNKVLDLSSAQEVLIDITIYDIDEKKILAADILAYLPGSDAQQAIFELAMDDNNAKFVRLSAFESLSKSAKKNGSGLDEDQIESLYNLVASVEAEADIRQGASNAFGALNLDSRYVKDLILDQAVK
jgi:HEAT repeat protein